jgi:hypothetical protein
VHVESGVCEYESLMYAGYEAKVKWTFLISLEDLAARGTLLFTSYEAAKGYDDLLAKLNDVESQLVNRNEQSGNVIKHPFRR